MGLARLAALHGVATSYEPAPGRTVAVPQDTVVSVLAALGVDATTPQAVRAALDEHAHWRANRLLPDTVVLRAPSGPAGGPEPPALSGDGPQAALSAAVRRPPLPPLPDGTVLTVETEDGAEVPWDGTAFFRGSAAPRTRAALGGWAAGGLPLGTHTLRAHAPDGRSARANLIVAPARMPAPRHRGYGLLVQLYSLLSTRSWGMGDLGDLAELAAWAGRSFGAGFVQLNPVHSAVPGTGAEPTDPSPYRPSSRRFPDPVHLRVEDVPEYSYLAGPARERAAVLLGEATELRESVLHQDALIDRDAVWRLKREALELVREVPLSPGRRAAYRAFLAERGQALDDHATWCALAEQHGPDWRAWPSGLRDPRSAVTERARGELLDRLDFHRWLAWLTDGQLAAAQRAAREAGMDIGLVHDLAVGVHPRGADVWAQQDTFATGMSIGAPPDAFNSRGQDWGLPPWRPDALAASGYAPFRELLRGLLRHAGALRIDHVMGLFRLWWLPEGREPTQGTYVRYDAEAMLGVLALEAHRAGAVVIGEDLGTVEPGVREALDECGVLGTSVLWFERDYASPAGAATASDGDSPAVPAGRPGPGGVHESAGKAGRKDTDGSAETGVPVDAAAVEADGGRARPLLPEEWRAGCLATATTHDLPSTAARLTGEHVALRHRLGLLTRPLEQEQAEDSAEVAEWLGLLRRLKLVPDGEVDEVTAIKAVYRFLARTPARMVGLWLPDGIGDRRPQNLPGTWDQYPNWRLPIADAGGRPVTLEQLTASPRLQALMAELAETLSSEAAEESSTRRRPPRLNRTPSRPLP